MMRRVGAWMLVLTSALLLASCSLRTDQRETASANSPTINKVADITESQLIGQVKVDEFNDQATGREVPVNGGQIVKKLESEPDSLNMLVGNDGYTQEVDQYIFDSLLRRDPETFEWRPQLAERWTEEDIVAKKSGAEVRGYASEPGGSGGEVVMKTDSGTVAIPRSDVQEVRHKVSFTFYLRKGVRFHDGVPLTATDVKFTFDTIKNDAVDDPALRNYYADLKKCEVIDDYTVRLTYSKQYWKALEFAASGYPILPKHIYDADNLQEKDPQAFGKRFNVDPNNRKPIGSGQYRFERWETGSQIIVARNDDYFDVPRRGHLDRIVFKFINDQVAALQALKNGEVNFVPRITEEQYEKETSDPDFLKRFAKVPYYTGFFNYIGWNMRKPPFNDAKVRLAMAYGSFDRKEFLQKALYGHGVMVTGSEYYFGPAYDHSIQPYPYDPEKAKQLLLEAGWYDRDGDGLRDKDGKPFRFELLMSTGRPIYVQLAALMKENLRKLGIDMTVRQLEWATFLENMADRKFDAIILAWGLPDPEDDPYQIWHSSQSKNRGSNHVGFGNAETDKLIEESRGMLDPAARRKMMFELHRIEHETQPYLFLYTPSFLGVYDKRYRGVKFYKVDPSYDLSEWYLPAGGTATASLK